MKLFTRQFCLWCSLLLFVSLQMACSGFATDERKPVKLFLKKDGKNYMFSRIGSFIIKNSLAKNESPPVVSSTRVVVKDGNIYIEPQHLKNMVTLISGNYEIHDYHEKSFDGYVTEGKNKVFKKKYSSESTENIGQMISTANIHLTNNDQTKVFHIAWQRSPNKIPLKNCIEMDLWIDKSYKPGERMVAKEKFIMINLNDIVEFYNSNIQLDYNEEDKILYVTVD